MYRPGNTAPSIGVAQSILLHEEELAAQHRIRKLQSIGSHKKINTEIQRNALRRWRNSTKHQINHQNPVQLYHPESLHPLLDQSEIQQKPISQSNLSNSSYKQTKKENNNEIIPKRNPKSHGRTVSAITRLHVQTVQKHQASQANVVERMAQNQIKQQQNINQTWDHIQQNVTTEQITQKIILL